MPEYEIVLLFHPRLSADDVAKAVDTFKEKTLQKAKITFEDFWGKKRLAYSIQKQDHATYVVLHFEFEGVKLSKLDEEICLDKAIIRHLITKLPKDAPKMTLQEIEAWNKENLDELKPKRSKPEPKRAQLRGRRPARPKTESEPKKAIDKSEFNKELDAILES